MLDTFITRTPFSYNIASLDNLLKTKEIPDSFLMYDEQVLSVLISAGIEAADAYVCLKAIKKKKFDKVESFKDRFRTGFEKHLIEDEHATEKEAQKIVDNVWDIIESSASYLFNASHSLCMACDSLYVAWLKAHYPYELYATMLQIFSKKKNKDKVANIISEMKRYEGIQLTPGRFRQDNRDWFVDKEHKLISQNLASVRYMQKQAAEDLYRLGLQEEAEMGVEIKASVLKKEAKTKISKIKKQLKPLHEQAEKMLAAGVDEFSDEFLQLYDKGYPLEQELKQIENDFTSYESRAQEVHHKAKLDCFTNVLRALQMNTRLDTRQIEILIKLNYFSEFGKTGKLMKVFDYFFENISKTHKSFLDRLEACRNYEASLEDCELQAGLRLKTEFENVGLCVSTDPNAPNSAYFVTDLDDKYGIKVKLYNIRRGTTGMIRIARKDYKLMDVGSCIVIDKYRTSPKFIFQNGQKKEVPGEKEIWVTDYRVLKKGEAGVA